MSDRDDSVVSFDRPRGAPPERLREFLETARRIKQERAAAEVVNELLRATAPEAWPTLATRPELQNNGALERLGNESRERLDRKPLEALALAELATTIADALPEDSYPPVVLAQIRAGAWKDRANALRYLGRHEEAFDAISHAEKTLMRHAALAVDRAVVDLVKAMILHQIGRRDECHDLLGEAQEVFAEFSDARHLLDSQLVQANFYYGEGNYVAARDLYEELLERVDALEFVACLHNNLGFCLTHLGEFTRANIQFSEATAKYTEAGAIAEAGRSLRGAGLLLIEKGQATLGLKRLSQAKEAFLKFGLVREAGRCGLDIAATLAERGDTQEAYRVTQEVRRDFETARLSPESIAALSRLEESIGAEAASPSMFRDVQTVITSTEATAS